jgi:hypothetical protein
MADMNSGTNSHRVDSPNNAKANVNWSIKIDAENMDNLATKKELLARNGRVT